MRKLTDVHPCPKCGGPVDMVKLPKTRKNRNPGYYIKCLNCKATCSNGIGFDDEPLSKAKERIAQYEMILKEA